jgi:hypothetical protein
MSCDMTRHCVGLRRLPVEAVVFFYEDETIISFEWMRQGL